MTQLGLDNMLLWVVQLCMLKTRLPTQQKTTSRQQRFDKVRLNHCRVTAEVYSETFTIMLTARTEGAEPPGSTPVQEEKAYRSTATSSRTESECHPFKLTPKINCYF